LQRPLAECPPETLPERLRPYLLEFGEDGEPTGLNAGRYEFWLYRQIRKRFKSGNSTSTTASGTAIFQMNWYRKGNRPQC
jgi:hypothetical protein